ncbi:MAG: hypothetical protein M1832_000640 [Thelocarpon impressellum]|nr:MAG: hypothetical protein M1832_000640 [Thelocarpon impressellum]
MAGTRVHASIAVFRGEPLDYQKWRHTALHFRFEDGQDAVVIHAVGTQGDFKVEIRAHYKPEESDKFAKAVPSVRPDNTSREYNCHTWVQEALGVLRDAGYISPETYIGAVDGMVGATMEAADDDFI